MRDRGLASMTAADQEAVPAGGGRATVPLMAAACGIMVGNIYLCQPLLGEMARGFRRPRAHRGLRRCRDAGRLRARHPLRGASRRHGRAAETRPPAHGGDGSWAGGCRGGTRHRSPRPGELGRSRLDRRPAGVDPLATSLVPPERRGRIIGVLQTGLILGILLSRTVSGTVASYAGTGGPLTFSRPASRGDSL